MPYSYCHSRYRIRVPRMNHARFYCTILLLVLLCLVLLGDKPRLVRSIAQSTSGNLSAWKRFTGKNEDFSILMPAELSLCLSSITDRSGKLTPERIYSSYSNGAVYLVVSYGRASTAETLKNSLRIILTRVKSVTSVTSPLLASMAKSTR